MTELTTMLIFEKPHDNFMTSSYDKFMIRNL